MKRTEKTLIAAALSTLVSSSASAVVLASTSFDGRTANGNTASGLNWTTNGIDDPGDMSALNASGGAQNLFNNTNLVQNMFVPGINTGNGNTFWTTSVALTVSGPESVALEGVTFDYWSVNGGQNQNVIRGSDFALTLRDPSGAEVGSVEVLDTLSGGVAGVPEVALTFGSPIALSAPGTYTLEIKGGDYAGINETGNHTGIDNLSIDGTVASVPEPSAILLSVVGLLSLATRRRR
ncbi:MAG: PEP-CTERM sorting domain-containing protein [Akkermansiaceae bacterium]